MLSDKCNHCRFLNSDILLRHKRMWLFLSLLSAMSIWDIPNAEIFKLDLWVRIVYAITVGAFKGTIMLLIYNWCWQWRLSRVVCNVLIFLYAIVSILNFVSFELYEFGLTRKMMFIIAQTTKNEVLEFVPGLFYNIIGVFTLPITYILLGLLIVLFYVIKYIGKKVFNSFIMIIGGIGLLLFAYYCLSFTSGRTAHSMVARTIKYGMEVYQWELQFERLKNSKKELPDKHTAFSRHIATNVVVVLGESASRNHHSLYGYHLPTTPLLDSMCDSLFVFTDAIGSSASTTGNMERILSFKEDDITSGDGLEYPLLVDYFKAVGYKTFWLSNQERTGNVSNTSGVMTMNADVIKYVGAENSEDALAIKFDEVLLPDFKEALSDTIENKMIFLHLYGSHVEFRFRYPADFQVFNANDELQMKDSLTWLDNKMAQRRAEYDNSIRYTDYILNDIIKCVSRIKEPSIVIYFSDHGENVYDEGAFSGRGEKNVEVPFMIYANNSYLTNNPDIKDKIEIALNRPFSTANVVYMLMSMTGSLYKYYNPAIDVLSPDYVPKPRYVDEKIWEYEHVID